MNTPNFDRSMKILEEYANRPNKDNSSVIFGALWVNDINKRSTMTRLQIASQELQALDVEDVPFTNPNYIATSEKVEEEYELYVEYCEEERVIVRQLPWGDRHSSANLAYLENFYTQLEQCVLDVDDKMVYIKAQGKGKITASPPPPTCCGLPFRNKIGYGMYHQNQHEFLMQHQGPPTCDQGYEDIFCNAERQCAHCEVIAKINIVIGLMQHNIKFFASRDAFLNAYFMLRFPKLNNDTAIYLYEKCIMSLKMVEYSNGQWQLPYFLLGKRSINSLCTQGLASRIDALKLC